MIKWKDDYKIGVEEIDEQHKRLFEIANRAYELLEDKFCIDKYSKIVDILEELNDYTVYHFKTEEEYMMGIGYKRFLSQKVEHDEFVKKLSDIDFDKIDEDQNKYILGILDFAVNWIAEHILTKDKLITSKI